MKTAAPKPIPARYSQPVPSCFLFCELGIKEKGITSSLHSATFNIDEDAVAIAQD
jgi:hypothetical protein